MYELIIMVAGSAGLAAPFMRHGKNSLFCW
jgi:hypothetical protein